MTMKTMDQLFDGYKAKFFRNMDERREKVSLPVRPRNKPTRLFIDNEYFSERYGEVLPPSALAVYAVLAKYANSRTQSCWPSVATIVANHALGASGRCSPHSRNWKPSASSRSAIRRAGARTATPCSILALG